MDTNKVVTEKIARKVLVTVDKGLSSGLGERKPGEMCVEAAVCYAYGLPHGDDPPCVSRSVRALKIQLNDSQWSSKAARAKGMRRLAIAQLGSADIINDKDFAKKVAEYSIRVSVPIALRAAASLQKDAHHKQALLDAASRCEKEGSESADSAWFAAESAAESAAWSAESAARYAARSAAESAESAAESAESAAESALSAAESALSAAESALSAAESAESAARSAAESAESAAESARSAARSAAWSAWSAWSVAESAARDKILSDFAEGIVQILIELKSPGCNYLYLTE